MEVLGDSCFQSAIYRSSGAGRIGWFALGASLLALYGLLVNLPQWDFGKLLGVYVVFFFVAAQVIAKVRFNQPVTLPVRVGGALIVAGGLVMSLWKS
jgi:small multidrug resistance family-3 protein